MPYPVVLGHAVPTLLDLLEQARSEMQLIREGHVEGTEAPVQEVEQHQPHPQPVVTACNIVTTRAQKAKNTLEELPFFHADLESGPVKQHKSGVQRRREKLLAMAREQCE